MRARASQPALWVSTFFFLALTACGVSSGSGSTNVTVGSKAVTVSSNVIGNSGVYNYSPSVMQVGSIQQFWWCGQGVNPNNPSQDTDAIWYESINLDTQAVVGPEVVLAETPGAWDSVYTCNAHVVQGVFTDPLGDGNNYTYAMYYSGTANSAGTQNSIGVAFSNNGISWVKYPTPAISYPSGETGYGLNQPIAYNSNGLSGITLWYRQDYPTLEDIEVTSTDGIHFATAGTITTNGLNQVGIAGHSSYVFPVWGDAAYDDSTSYWYAVFNMQVRPSSTTGSVIERGQPGVIVYKIPASALLTGSTAWQQVFTVDTNLTGYEGNFIPTFLRDQYGNLNVSGTYPDIELYTSTSIPQPAWNSTPATRANSASITHWDILSEVWTPEASLIPFNRYYNGTVYEVTTGWVDPNGGFTLESTLARLYETPQAGATVAFYGCLNGNNDYFVSTNSNCEGTLFLGINGYAFSSPGTGRVALYRCYTGTDHFVSTASNCEGQTQESLLGYGLSN